MRDISSVVGADAGPAIDKRMREIVGIIYQAVEIVVVRQLTDAVAERGISFRVLLLRHSLRGAKEH